MKRAARMLLMTLGLCANGAGLAQAVDEQDFRFSGIERVVAIADIHGAWAPFVSLLQGTGLVDAQLQWTGAASHLVIVGDILDRGAESRQVLDLVMHLEQQAPEAGGAVHMVLGNHEIMNMTGELAYVSRAEFEAYRDLENAGMRRAAQDRFAAQTSGLGTLALRTAFTRQFPRGYFGHRSAFAADGIYGSWLLRQPVVLVINETAFVHAGLSAALLESDVTAVNAAAASALSGYLSGMQLLIDAEVLHPETDFLEHPARLERYLRGARARNPPELSASAETLLQLRAGEPFDPASTVWYRGMVDCSPALEHDRVQQALARLGVSRLVVGHTPTRNHQVQQRFDSALVLADTGMLADYYGGQPSALIFEDGAMSVFYADSGATAAPVPQPRMVGPRTIDLDDAGLETLLREAPIFSQSDLGAGRRQVQLQQDGVSVAALFVPAPANGTDVTFIPEVAAYRLDRLLQLDVVPVAVARTLDGVAGAVFIDDSALASAAALTEDARSEAWCPIEDQLAVMQIFDVLINTPARPAAQQRFTSGNWKLALTGNHDVLSADAGAPLSVDVPVSAFLRAQLQALNETLLGAQLGDVLDAERRAALLHRRDRLLAGGR